MNCVANDVVMICSNVLLCLKPINIVPKPFWVIGGLKMGFLDENGVRNRRLISAQMNTRSSEIPFAQASDTLLHPVWIFSRSLKRATSEPQASKMLTFVICVA